MRELLDLKVNVKAKILLLVLGFVFWSCGNNPPFINSLTADPETVSIGGTVLLTCDAYDDEDTSLVYSWDCTSGAINGEDNTATWVAPDETGVFSISCEVMDGSLGNAIETIDIMVVTDTTAS